MKLTRRSAVAGGIGAGLLGSGLWGSARVFTDRGQVTDIEAGDPWNAHDEIEHLIPTVSHDRIRIKASFNRPFDRPPHLRVGDFHVEGVQSDSDGHFYTFDAKSLAPATSYMLELTEVDGSPLSGVWPLKTFPHPAAVVDHVRILTFTCAGGADFLRYPDLNPLYLPRSVRKRLIARGLDFEPDFVVANGDHIYWDMDSRPGLVMGRSPLARLNAGTLDREKSVLGTSNESTLKALAKQQIPDVYGTLLRSTPAFFIQDDHDYFENDELVDGRPTFPASSFMREAAAAVQALYYPEFVDTQTLPSSEISIDGLSRKHGAIRFGQLAELLAFDCRTGMSLGPGGQVLSSKVEQWILARNDMSPARHVLNFPSLPILWTAGKWGEWYPDSVADNGDLVTSPQKEKWPEGWLKQHDRLVLGSAQHSERSGIWISGDLHATGIGEIIAVGEHSLAASPVTSVLAGSIGTGERGWPSVFRGTGARPSQTLNAREMVPPIEENGFSILDVTPDEIQVSQFRWLPENGIDAIARLEAFNVSRIARL